MKEEKRKTTEKKSLDEVKEEGARNRVRSRLSAAVSRRRYLIIKSLREA